MGKSHEKLESGAHREALWACASMGSLLASSPTMDPQLMPGKRTLRISGGDEGIELYRWENLNLKKPFNAGKRVVVWCGTSA